jgi:hypothetical protein
MRSLSPAVSSKGKSLKHRTQSVGGVPAKGSLFDTNKDVNDNTTVTESDDVMLENVVDHDAATAQGVQRIVCDNGLLVCGGGSPDSAHDCAIL